MTQKPTLIATDLEGVLIPEVWINVAKKTGIEKLNLTTRDITDYDELMKLRLDILDKHKLTLKDIQKVIATLDPLPGAAEYLKWARENHVLVILSDTFYEFAAPLMRKLDNPALFCHTLQTDVAGCITGYKLRITDGKKEAVNSFKKLGFKVISIGDSYNDTSMLKEADQGILFNAPENVIKDFPEFPTTNTYEELKEQIRSS